MKTLTLSTVVFATLASAIPTLETRDIGSSGGKGPIVDLGTAGKYLGVVQNNGTVHSWKGEIELPSPKPSIELTSSSTAIPYAAPPVGDLRFKPPTALTEQTGTVVDVSQDFPGKPTACVQFGTTSFVGINASPGQEDCLKVSLLLTLLLAVLVP